MKTLLPLGLLLAVPAQAQEDRPPAEWADHHGLRARGHRRLGRGAAQLRGPDGGGELTGPDMAARPALDFRPPGPNIHRMATSRTRFRHNSGQLLAGI